MKQVGASEAKNQLSMLLDLEAQGEDVLITRHGKPVARLVPPEGAFRKQDAAAVARIREDAAAAKLGKFDWTKWKTIRMKARVEPDPLTQRLWDDGARRRGIASYTC